MMKSVLSICDREGVIMKKSINFWSFAAGTTVQDAIKLAKDAGFNGVELAMAQKGLTGLETENAGKEARKIAADEGIVLPTLASGLCWDYLLTSTLKEVRQQAKDMIRRQVDLAHELGAEAILVIPGAVGVDFLPGGGSNLMPYDEAYDASLDALKELAPYAEQAKVNLALENVWNKFLLSPLEFRDFIDKIGSDFVGCYFDVGNVLLTGYPEQWIRILGKRIKAVHLKDYRRDPGGFNCFCDLLSGDVNYPSVMEAFDSIGYSGWFAPEMIPNYKHYSSQTIYNASSSCDRILNRK
jgi:hexulose-6-phosphate isomerase